MLQMCPHGNVRDRSNGDTDGDTKEKAMSICTETKLGGRCTKAAGHEDWHSNGVYSWSTPLEKQPTEAGDFLRMVADAWGADPDGWSHYIETDRDTRNLLRDLAEKLDKQQYDLN